jgi:NTP pyrophosphatase (non-canonical NTP hydrolase)
MTLNEYQELALRTHNPTHTEVQTLTNAALGLTGEAGEFADMVKKHIFHGHGMPLIKSAKELGDVLWYVSLAAHAIGVPLENIAAENIKKLQGRYPDGFSEEASKNRVE